MPPGCWHCPRHSGWGASESMPCPPGPLLVLKPYSVRAVPTRGMRPLFGPESWNRGCGARAPHPLPFQSGSILSFFLERLSLLSLPPA